MDRVIDKKFREVVSGDVLAFAGLDWDVIVRPGPEDRRIEARPRGALVATQAGLEFDERDYERLREAGRLAIVEKDPSINPLGKLYGDLLRCLKDDQLVKFGEWWAEYEKRISALVQEAWEEGRGVTKLTPTHIRDLHEEHRTADALKAAQELDAREEGLNRRHMRLNLLYDVGMAVSKHFPELFESRGIEHGPEMFIPGPMRIELNLKLAEPETIKKTVSQMSHEMAEHVKRYEVRADFSKPPSIPTADKIQEKLNDLPPIGANEVQEVSTGPTFMADESIHGERRKVLYVGEFARVRVHQNEGEPSVTLDIKHKWQNEDAHVSLGILEAEAVARELAPEAFVQLAELQELAVRACQAFGVETQWGAKYADALDDALTLISHSTYASRLAAMAHITAQEHETERKHHERAYVQLDNTRKAAESKLVDAEKLTGFLGLADVSKSSEAVKTLSDLERGFQEGNAHGRTATGGGVRLVRTALKRQFAKPHPADSPHTPPQT